MATTNDVFIIHNTAGVPVAAIQPNTLNGPDGVQQSSDLRLYGLGFATWGEGADENDYRLLENFACPESTTTPGTPQGSDVLGDGNGITAPIVGQLWFNTSAQKMFVYGSTGWGPLASGVIVGSTQPSPPSLGELWYDTTVPQLKVYNGSAFVSVANLYLPLSGGSMTGAINMANNNIAAVGTMSVNEIDATSYRASNGIASNQITIPVSGATTISDGPRIGTNIIIHTGNAAALNSFTTGMIMGWRSPTPPAGWAICDGTNGTPDLRDRFIVGAGNSYASGGTYGSLTPSLTIASAGAHSHTGATGSHVLVLSEMPAHTHEILYAQGSHASGSGAHYTDLFGLGYQTTIQAGPSAGTQIIQNTGGNGGHTHTISSDGTHTHTGTVTSNIPPAYGLFWIMKL